MKIFVTGGTGFVGTYLSDHLVQHGNEVTILARSVEGSKAASPGITYLQGDWTQRGPWQDSIRDHDVIINLAGASIFSRWTEAYKKLLIESRISTTRNLVEGIPTGLGKQITLFSTSAVGYYGFHEDEELIEESSPGDDFLARLAVEWETEAFKAEEHGGALGQMIPSSRCLLEVPSGAVASGSPGSTSKTLQRPSFSS